MGSELDRLGVGDQLERAPPLAHSELALSACLGHRGSLLEDHRGEHDFVASAEQHRQRAGIEPFGADRDPERAFGRLDFCFCFRRALLFDELGHAREKFRQLLNQATDVVVAQHEASSIAGIAEPSARH